MEITLDSAERFVLKSAFDRYLAEAGIGQYSHFRFADFVIEEEPELTRSLIGKVVRQWDLTNERK